MKPILHGEEPGVDAGAHLDECVECSLIEAMRRDAIRADEAATRDAAPMSDDDLDAILAGARAPATVPAPVSAPSAPVVRGAFATRVRARRQWALVAFAAVLILAAAAIAASRWAAHEATAPAVPAVSTEPSPIEAPPEIPSVPAPSAPEAPTVSEIVPPRATAAPALVRPAAEPSSAAAKPDAADATETAATLFARANEARRGGRAAEALGLYDALSARFPGSREGVAARSIAGWLLLEQLGQPAAALARFDRYLASSGGTLAQEALAGRALALSRLGRTSEELAAWRKLLDVAPSGAYAPRARARLGEGAK